MGLGESALFHARYTAAKYIDGHEGLTERQLILAMEQRAYELARVGAGSDARSLLVSVAELELSKQVSGMALQQGACSDPAFGPSCSKR